MKKCINCGIEIEQHKKYCSYSCRNIYVNKNLRDYSKNSETVKNKFLNKYLENPKYCKHCGNVIAYEKKNNKFCNSSCAATFTNKNRERVVITEKGLNNLRKGIKIALKYNYPNHKRHNKEYLNNPNYCIECNNELSYKYRKRKFCNKKCQNNYQRKNLSEYQKYYKDCKFKFALNKYSNEFDFSLIEKHGWYKAKNHGDNLNGVSRDHMFSIKEGFEFDVDSKIISHPANCKLMKHNENNKKDRNSSITIEELKEKIINWNLKYAEFV